MVVVVVELIGSGGVIVVVVELIGSDGCCCFRVD